MRVALVVPGGVGRAGERPYIPVLHWFIRRLATRHDVRVIALAQKRHRDSWDLAGATVLSIGVKLRRARAIRLLTRLHREAPFDVFHAFWVRGAGDVALAASRLCHRPVLVHVAGGELVWLPEIRYGGARRRWSRWASRFVLRRADRVTVASGPIEALARRFGATPIRLPLGVDLECWAPSPPRPRSPDQPGRLVQLAHFNRVKDQATLLRTVAILRNRGMPVHLDLVGSDYTNGAVYRHAEALGLTECITFHGYLPPERAVPVVRAADLMVVSSRHEAGPIAMLEAAAVGVPTVGTAVGHLRDLTSRRPIVVPPGRADLLADLVGAVVRDDGWRLELAHQMQAMALVYNADWTAERFEALYEEITARREASANVP